MINMTFIDYHRRSIRLKTHNYRNGGQYFITICTKNREPAFGHIQNGIMGLSEIGCIVAHEWQKTPVIRPYITLDAWIVMPDHFHGILNIDDGRANDNDGRAPGGDDGRAPYHGAPTGWMADSLGSIIGQFKIVTTKRIRKINPVFEWQRNYHEHIIRSENERLRIRRYIMNNPAHWNIDPDAML